MDKTEIKRLINEHYDILVTEYGVSKVGIFGSAAKGTMTEDSDLDIYVEFKKPIGFTFVRFVEYLENLFERKVGVITKDGIENIRVKEVAKDIKRTLSYV
ncbi:MAG: nucleotidyltransferase [Candidatus Scalindua sp. AMX11]|nr:MAG: nucleotidyltransferase [Candidatus Scalindua sp.]NOG85356.1 nucleotidyltransferase [Planctomycetota bacterium]RZV83957.1 MAG: nucleotidyltransferase [Candidatus Scalindua sp. SCAELEC01]TDE65768.1 MAG: nucleotidyltransferase [Candidatus Scalindua sp. AMX11]GJQ59628.1 MAG: nucleotidyltransferase [Candidatus Scalindua sp.]